MYDPNMRLILRPLTDWPRAKDPSPVRSRFDAGWSSTVQLLDDEVTRIRNRDQYGLEVVIEIAAPRAAFRKDGTGLLADARPDYHGVIISFDSKYGPKQFVADHFNKPSWARNQDPSWHANVRAIALGLEHLRTVDRYGIADHGQQYTGWNALGSGIPMPAPTMTVEEAARLLFKDADLGYKWEDLLDDPKAVLSAFRKASKRHHPDAGGDADEFKRLTEARDLLVGAR